MYDYLINNKYNYYIRQYKRCNKVSIRSLVIYIILIFLDFIRVH